MPDQAARPLLLALGDSITAGVGGRWNRGYPHHLQELLELAHAEVKLINWGIPGLTSAGLHRALQKGTHLHDKIASATWIVMTIGGNDLLDQVPPELWKQPPHESHAAFAEHLRDALLQQASFAEQLRDLLRTLRTLTACPLYLGDLYNPFPYTPLARHLLGEVNRTVLHPLARTEKHLHVVRVSDVLAGREPEVIDFYKTGTIQDLKRFRKWRRPIHPNDAGHALIARAFYEKMLATR